MESIYWVATWACHRRCRHCYDERFRPYARGDLQRVVGEGRRAYQTILANLPDDMTWRDPKGGRKRTRLILAGGELLIDGVREELFFPILEGVAARWGAGAPLISVQTTGDVMTPAHIEAMLARGVSNIAVASIDDHHVGMNGARKFKFMDKVRAMMAPFGLTEVSLGPARDPRLKTPAPRAHDAGATFLFFGAQPELWIGELWPRGRAWANGLSRADYATNFCARWSGGKGFLEIGEAGCEVAIEPSGAVYPCCLKTKTPLGDLTEERLVDILASLKGHPAFEALNAGDPERMGESEGWSRTDFRRASSRTDPTGRTVENLCLGCDAFFEAHLEAALREIAAARRARAQAR